MNLSLRVDGAAGEGCCSGVEIIKGLYCWSVEIKMYKMYMTPNLSAIARPKGVAGLDKVIWHF